MAAHSRAWLSLPASLVLPQPATCAQGNTGRETVGRGLQAGVFDSPPFRKRSVTKAPTRERHQPGDACTPHPPHPAHPHPPPPPHPPTHTLATRLERLAIPEAQPAPRQRHCVCPLHRQGQLDDGDVVQAALDDAILLVVLQGGGLVVWEGEGRAQEQGGEAWAFAALAHGTA